MKNSSNIALNDIESIRNEVFSVLAENNEITSTTSANKKIAEFIFDYALVKVGKDKGEELSSNLYTYCKEVTDIISEIDRYGEQTVSFNGTWVTMTAYSSETKIYSVKAGNQFKATNRETAGEQYVSAVCVFSDTNTFGNLINV